MVYFANLKDNIDSIKRFGKNLIPYNFPRVATGEENDINFLKSREVLVDGYNILVHYSVADYGDYYFHSLQIFGKYSPFLPFNLICNIGKQFFGDKYLSLVELYKDNRKIYCWALSTKPDGTPIPTPYQFEHIEHTYEGFVYNTVDSSQINFH